MDLKFLRIHDEHISQLKECGVRIYFYSTEEKTRKRIDANLIKSAGYCQMPLDDLSLISNIEFKTQIESYNDQLLKNWEEFKVVRSRYAPHFQESWSHLSLLAEAMRADDFTSLHLLILADLTQLIPNSPFEATISNCLEKTLRRDSRFSRMISFSYCCLRYLKYENQSLTFNFLAACLFKDLGLSQLKSLQDRNSVYDKHSYYSLFLLKKLPLELSAECQLFILDHHESPDGSGLPRGKTDQYFHPLCGVLKAAEMIFSSEDFKEVMATMMRSNHGKFYVNGSTAECLKIVYSYLAHP